MSNPGKRPQPSSGTLERGSSKRTSEASRNSPSPTVQAATAPARTMIPISAVLSSSDPASSLPGQPELPVRSGREPSSQPERELQGKSRLWLASQPSEGAGRPIGQFDSQPSLRPGFRPDGGADPISTTLNRRPNQEAGFRPRGDAAPLNRESGPQPSGNAAPPSTAFVPLNREQFGSEPSRELGLALIGRSMPQPGPPVGLQPVGGADPPLYRPSIAQPRPPVALRHRGGAEPPLSRPSVPQPRAPIGVQPSGEPDPQLSMGPFSQPRFSENFMFDAILDPQSGRAASPQPSQEDDGRKRMDLFRFDLLRLIFSLRHMARQEEHGLSNSRPDVTTVSGATGYAQIQARAKFLISDMKKRSARLANQFKTSYCPAIRDSGAITHHYYDPEICRIFKSHTDPRERLLMLEVKAQSLRLSTIDTNAKFDLYCQYILVVEEERSELLDNAAHPNTLSQSTQPVGEDLVRRAAQVHSRETGGTGDAQSTTSVAIRTVQGDGSQVSSRRGHAPQTVPSHARKAGPTEAHTAQGSSSGISGIRDARPTSHVASPITRSGDSRVSLRGGHGSRTDSSRARSASPAETVTQDSSSGIDGLIPAASSNASEDRRRWASAAARALFDVD